MRVKRVCDLHMVLHSVEAVALYGKWLEMRTCTAQIAQVLPHMANYVSLQSDQGSQRLWMRLTNHRHSSCSIRPFCCCVMLDAMKCILTLHLLLMLSHTVVVFLVWVHHELMHFAPILQSGKGIQYMWQIRCLYWTSTPYYLHCGGIKEGQLASHALPAFGTGRMNHFPRLCFMTKWMSSATLVLWSTM